MTTIHMFKNHPRKKEIRFIVLPMAREYMRSFASVPMNIDDLMGKYRAGSERNYGIEFDWSLLLGLGGDP